MPIIIAAIHSRARLCFERCSSNGVAEPVQLVAGREDVEGDHSAGRPARQRQVDDDGAAEAARHGHRAPLAHHPTRLPRREVHLPVASLHRLRYMRSEGRLRYLRHNTIEYRLSISSTCCLFLAHRFGIIFDAL